MVAMWTADPVEDAAPVRIPYATGVVIVAAVAFTIVVGIVPGWLIDATDTITLYAR